MAARLEFTPGDIARTRIGPPLGPFGETVHALGQLVRRHRSVALRGWFSEVKAQLTPYDRAMGSFLWLSPSVGFDFYTIAEPTDTMRDGREALLDVDRDLFSIEAEYWALVRNHARRLRLPDLDGGGLAVVPPGLRSGTTDGRRRLFADVARVHDTAVAPWWPRIGDHLLEQREGLARQLGGGGVEAVWQALGDQVRWTGTALDLPNVGVAGDCDKHYQLGGRGVVVVTSFFAREPAVYFPEDRSAPVMLIVPRPSAAVTESAARPPVGRKTDLLGPTRTAVLEAVARRPHSTTDLGQTLGIAVSSASYHATVLRRAGLVRTTRDGGRVLHTATHFGRTLLGQLPRYARSVAGEGVRGAVA